MGRGWKNCNSYWYYRVAFISMKMVRFSGKLRMSFLDMLALSRHKFPVQALDPRTSQALAIACQRISLLPQIGIQFIRLDCTLLKRWKDKQVISARWSDQHVIHLSMHVILLSTVHAARPCMHSWALQQPGSCTVGRVRQGREGKVGKAYGISPNVPITLQGCMLRCLKCCFHATSELTPEAMVVVYVQLHSCLPKHPRFERPAADIAN